MSALTLVKPISVIIWPQKVFTCLDLVFKVNMPHLSLKNCMTRNSISTKGREPDQKWRHNLTQHEALLNKARDRQR